MEPNWGRKTLLRHLAPRRFLSLVIWQSRLFNFRIRLNNRNIVRSILFIYYRDGPLKFYHATPYITPFIASETIIIRQRVNDFQLT